MTPAELRAEAEKLRKRGRTNAARDLERRAAQMEAKR